MCNWVSVLCLFLVAVTAAILTDIKYIQDRTIISYVNEKYMINAQAFTARKNRKSPYKTNITAETLQPWANNVTYKGSHTYQNKGNDLGLILPICDFLSNRWMKEWLKVFSNIPPRCPIMPGIYKLINMELPPPGFPMLLPTGRIIANSSFFITDTKEPILTILIFMHT